MFKYIYVSLIAGMFITAVMTLLYLHLKEHNQKTEFGMKNLARLFLKMQKHYRESDLCIHCSLDIATGKGPHDGLCEGCVLAKNPNHDEMG